jgi:hypothetical protein
MTPMNLGEKEWQSGWRIKAVPTLQGVLNLSRQLIYFVGMTPDGPPDVRSYPIETGAAGSATRSTSPWWNHGW